MTDDWHGGSSSTSPAEPVEPTEGPEPAGPAPGFEQGSNPFTDGWGGGNFDLDELKENFGRVWEVFKGPILTAWIGLAVLALLFQTFVSSLDIVHYYTDVGAIGLFSTILGWFSGPLVAIIAAFQNSLWRPMTDEIFEGESARVSSPVEALKRASGVVLMVFIATLLYGALWGIGSLLCGIPGLAVIFFLSMGIYLTATRPDLNPIEAFHTSFQYAKRHWGVMLAALVAVFIASGIGGCGYAILTVGMGVAASAIYPFGLPLVSIGVFLFVELALLVTFLFWSTVFVTIDRREQAR